MKIYVVIDTNVLISGMLKSTSIPGEVLKAVLDGKITPLVNDDIIKEYLDVVYRNKFGFGEKVVLETMLPLMTKSIYLDSTNTDEFFTDEDDIVFYQIALTGKKLGETYLITGNSKHFPNETFVVTPKQMMDILNNK